MNIFNIENAFKEKKRRKWSKLFWAIDLHNTIIPGTYSLFNNNREFYPGAKEVLQWLTNRRDMVFILWTSSHKEPIDDIRQWLLFQGIKVDYVNCNPEVGTDELCDFDGKFYFNVLLDDKAGFEGNCDWLLIKSKLQQLREWDK